MKIIIILYLIYFISNIYPVHYNNNTITNDENTNILIHEIKIPIIVKIWIFTEILMNLFVN